MKNWLIVTTENGRRRCPDENVFCVKDEYLHEISKVHAGDQIIAASRSRGWFRIDGQFIVTKAAYSRPFMRYGKETFTKPYTLYRKDTYTYCIGIKPVKILADSVFPERMIKRDLKDKYGDYISYFNKNNNDNNIKEIKDYEFSRFKNAIDLRDSWKKHSWDRFDRALLFPLNFSGFHFQEFYKKPLYTILLKFSKIKVILYSFDNGRLRFHGHADIAVYNTGLKLKGYKKFNLRQPSLEVQQILEKEDEVTINHIGDLFLPVCVV